MAIYREEEDIVVERRDSFASNAVWAIALIIITAIIVGAFYYSGLGGKIFRSTEKKVDINITTPAR